MKLDYIYKQLEGNKEMDGYKTLFLYKTNW